MKTIKLFFALFLAVSIFSCETDNNEPINPQNNTGTTPGSTEFSLNFGNQISRTFLGKVIDTNENPLENVTISIGGDVTSTDANGVFIINDALVNQRFAYVKAEKTGYIHGSRSLTPTTGTNKVTIMLLEETIAGTTSDGVSETISLSNGASVSLNGEYVNEDGTEYTGSVDVIMHHLDPTDVNNELKMPGMLYAENTDGEERMLETLGMLAVELRGAGNEDLNLAEGSTAEIRIPVDASLLASAPATIPLWYFDETNGYWIEEGEATLTGNEYIGTVAHFSFWNCDIPAEAINLCVTVVDESGNPIANSNVTITSTTYGTRGGYTNENGEVCGLVPSNETLELNVNDYDLCGSNSLYTASIGPYSADDTLNVTIPSSPNIVSETITGTFNDCDDNAVSNGYVVLTYADQQFTSIVENGAFEINMIRCTDDATFVIEAFDYDNLQTSGEINYTFSTPTTDLGTLTSCNTVEEFIQYSIDNGAEDSLIVGNIQADFYTTGTQQLNISGNNAAGTNDCFYMFGSLTSTPYEGVYDYLDWNSQNDIGFNISECQDISAVENNIIFNLTSLGDVGEYIDINFSGDYSDNQGNPHTITGVVHVLRDN